MGGPEGSSRIVADARAKLQVQANTDDLTFAREAVSRGLLEQHQADEVCSLVSAARAQGMHRVVPEVLVRLGLLTPEQVRAVLEVTGQGVTQCRQCGARYYTHGHGPEGSSCPRCGVATNVPVGTVEQQTQAHLLVGTTLGDYELLELAGSGGMSDVYKARNVPLDRIVALKVFARDFVGLDPRRLKRFYREAKSAARLNHPNVVTIYHVGEVEGRPFIEMEYIQGQSLGRLLEKQHVLEPSEAVPIFRQVAEALACAHEVGVIHRDIKPENIIVTPEGRVKVTDFGLAKMSDESVAITGIGRAVGTPYYIAPELIGGYQVDARTDLYSLGVTMYEALVGERPFSGKRILDLLIAHKEQEPRDPCAVNPRLSPQLGAVVLRLLRKDPDARFQSARELIEALDEAMVRKPELLAWLQPEGRYRLVPLGTEPVTIGRSHENTIALQDLRVSRRHTQIFRVGDETKVLDLGSRNGTWVNGERVLEQVLHPGDLLRVGDVWFVYLGAHAGAAPPASYMPPVGALLGSDVVTQGMRFDIRKGSVVIGSHPLAGFRLEAKGVAAFHAHLRATESCVVLTDLTNEAGTSVRGRKVTTQTLADNDSVAFGMATFIYLSERTQSIPLPAEAKLLEAGARTAKAPEVHCNDSVSDVRSDDKGIGERVVAPFQDVVPS